MTHPWIVQHIPESQPKINARESELMSATSAINMALNRTPAGASASSHLRASAGSHLRVSARALSGTNVRVSAGAFWCLYRNASTPSQCIHSPSQSPPRSLLPSPKAPTPGSLRSPPQASAHSRASTADDKRAGATSGGKHKEGVLSRLFHRAGSVAPTPKQPVEGSGSGKKTFAQRVKSTMSFRSRNASRNKSKAESDTAKGMNGKVNGGSADSITAQ